jgi:hypothetical protein
MRRYCWRCDTIPLPTYLIALALLVTGAAFHRQPVRCGLLQLMCKAVASPRWRQSCFTLMLFGNG